jgi:NADPH-dependent curcumin reductase CurA
MVNGGRVALCGLIANYTSGARPSDDYSVIIVKRLAVRGFLAFDYADTQQSRARLIGWVQSGRIKAEETIEDGLENAPSCSTNSSKAANAASFCCVWQTTTEAALRGDHAAFA